MDPLICFCCQYRSVFCKIDQDVRSCLSLLLIAFLNRKSKSSWEDHHFFLLIILHFVLSLYLLELQVASLHTCATQPGTTAHSDPLPQTSKMIQKTCQKKEVGERTSKSFKASKKFKKTKTKSTKDTTK